MCNFDLNQLYRYIRLDAITDIIFFVTVLIIIVGCLIKLLRWFDSSLRMGIDDRNGALFVGLAMAFLWTILSTWVINRAIPRIANPQGYVINKYELVECKKPEKTK